MITPVCIPWETHEVLDYSSNISEIHFFNKNGEKYLLHTFDVGFK